MKVVLGKKWYKPREIAKLGLITNSKGKDGSASGHYAFIISLINSGQLRARNYGRGANNYWLVPEDEIERYHILTTKIRG